MNNKFAIALISMFIGQVGWAESVPEAIARIEAELNELKHEVASPDEILMYDELTNENIKLKGGDVYLDGDDVTRAAFYLGPSHNGNLAFRDAKGQLLLNVGQTMGDEGRPSVGIFNENHKRIAWFGRWSNEDYAGLYVADDQGNRGVELNGDGRILVKGTNVHDYAEVFSLATRKGMHPGSVVAYAPIEGGLVLASRNNAKQVVGVISGAGGLRPGMVIGSREDGSQDLPVSMNGITYVRVVGEAGSIMPGDLLVSSSTPGVGMRAPTNPIAQGEVFGKALEPHERDDEGLVLMLVLNN